VLVAVLHSGEEPFFNISSSKDVKLFFFEVFQLLLLLFTSSQKNCG
jgi:hypothetical protein